VDLLGITNGLKWERIDKLNVFNKGFGPMTKLMSSIRENLNSSRFWGNRVQYRGGHKKHVISRFWGNRVLYRA
jgi:hypothetical protein